MSRDYDFYSPFFSAAIITSDGTRVPLWTNMAGQHETALAETFSDEKGVTNGIVSFPFLESLTIEMGLGFFPRMNAVLTPPLQDSRKFLDSTLVENGKATLEAIIGYSAGTSSGPVLSAPFQALILEPDISLGLDSTVTLNALGVAGYSASVTQVSRSFTHKKRRDILVSLAGGPSANGTEAAADISNPLAGADAVTAPTAFEVNADSNTATANFFRGREEVVTPEVKVSAAPVSKRVRRNLYLDFSGIKKGSAADKALDTEVDVAQGWKTDWMFMLQLAHEAGCWLTMSVKKEDDQEKNYVQVIEISSHLAEDPKYTLRFFDYVQGVLGPGHENINTAATVHRDSVSAEGDFPILSVSTQSKQVWLPGSTKALVASGVSSRTGKVVSRVWSDWNASPATVTGGGGTTPTPDGNNLAVDKGGAGAGRAPVSDPDVKAGDTVNQSRFITDFSMGIALRILTLGIPDIFPGNVVAVRGVGSRFDFNYGVFTVRHMLGPSGFTTELELVSNTSALLSSVQKAQGTVNEKKAKSQGHQIEIEPKEQSIEEFYDSKETVPKPKWLKLK